MTVQNRRRSRPAPHAFILVAAMASACGYLDNAPPEPAPGSMVLLPGYRHSTGAGMDTKVGRIWKWGGPNIVYEIGGAKPNLAQVLPGIVSVRTEMFNDDELTIIAHDKNQLSVMFQNANFEAENVRTLQDADDVVRMVKSYSSPYWPKAPAR